MCGSRNLMMRRAAAPMNTGWQVMRGSLGIQSHVWRASEHRMASDVHQPSLFKCLRMARVCGEPTKVMCGSRNLMMPGVLQRQ